MAMTELALAGAKAGAAEPVVVGGTLAAPSAGNGSICTGPALVTLDRHIRGFPSANMPCHSDHPSLLYECASPRPCKSVLIASHRAMPAYLVDGILSLGRIVPKFS
jgi:hypothetical protein